MDMHLYAVGRVQETTYIKDMVSSRPHVVYNTSGIIDGAHLDGYDKDTNSVSIRIDHSETPSFWIGLTLPLDKLAEFVKREKEFDGQ